MLPRRRRAELLAWVGPDMPGKRRGLLRYAGTTFLGVTRNATLMP
jgi:hypothetical protein